MKPLWPSILLTVGTTLLTILIGKPAQASGARWVPATRFRAGRPSAPKWIVLHSAEMAITPGAASSLASWWAGPGSPATSCHYIVGPTEVIQVVREEDTAWCAGSAANAEGIHLELIGFALETDWLGEGRPVLERAAPLVRAIAERHGIPLVVIGPDGLRAGLPGLTTHASATAAWGQSTHVDPGGPGDARWPWAEFLKMVTGG